MSWSLKSPQASNRSALSAAVWPVEIVHVSEDQEVHVFNVVPSFRVTISYLVQADITRAILTIIGQVMCAEWRGGYDATTVDKKAVGR